MMLLNAILDLLNLSGAIVKALAFSPSQDYGNLFTKPCS